MEWKNHEITQAIRSELLSRVKDYTEYLQENAGKDSMYDRFITGYLAGVKDFIDAEYVE